MSEENRRLCAKCGGEIVRGKVYCPNCGTKVDSEVEIIRNGDNSRKRRIVILVSVLVAIGIIAAIISSQQGSDYVSDFTPSTKTKTTTNTSVSTASAYCKISGVTVTHERNYTYVKGTIKNTSSTTKYRYIKVKASCKDRSGKVIDTDWCYAVDSAWLEPGESKSFEMMVKDENGQIKSATVTIMSD